MSIATTSAVLPSKYVTIEEECKRNPKLKMSDLQILKDWIDKQPHLPKVEMFYLVLFLHKNNYSLELTKEMIDEFFTIRTQIPEVFSNRDPVAREGLRKAFTATAIVPLEQKIKNGCVIIFQKILDTNPRIFDTHECLKYLFMTADLLHIRNGTSRGQIIICDASGLSFGHLARINITHIKTIIRYIQEVVPIKLRAIHILNTMYLIQMLMRILKPFLSEEFIKLVHFHTTLETLKEFVPIEALPNEYGGKAGPIMEINAKHIKLLEENREWFLYVDANSQVNESLRFTESQSVENLSGSLEKEEID